ncbi:MULTISPECIES: hypothetical protein [Pseudomonas]|jgi:hypothetical protein|nr:MULTISPECIES: hypothetical protein [Pseudomonas]
MIDLYTAASYDRKEHRSADFLKIYPGLLVFKRTDVLKGAQAMLIR